MILEQYRCVITLKNPTNSFVGFRVIFPLKYK